ncbi:MAG: MFS transporter [Pseudomonadota bacterium]
MSTTQRTSQREGDAFVSWREFLKRADIGAVALVCFAVWLHAADSLIVATMLPSIVADIGGAGLVGWSVSMYEIASVAAGASSALLTMRYGLRLPMSLAACLFGFGCLMSALAPMMPVMLLGRVFQGIGGGGLVAMSFVAVSVLFPRRYSARALALVSTFWGVSAFLGPLIGGIFVEFATWRWGFGFFAAQAFCLAAWIAMRRDLPAPKGTTSKGLPLRRLGLLSLAVLLVSYAGVDIAPVRTSVIIGLGLVCLALFFWVDHRAKDDRLMPLGPLNITKSTGSALVMTFSMSLATIAITAYGPLLLTAIHGASALTAGYVIACSSIGWSLAAVLVSGAPERFDRMMIAVGMIVVALSILGFLLSVPNGPIWLIAVFALLEGAGFGMAWTFILRRTTGLADPEEVQRIAGSLPTVQRLGYALGAAYIGIVANALGFASSDTPQETALIAQWVFFACMPFAVFGLLAMVALVRRAPGVSRIRT